MKRTGLVPAAMVTVVLALVLAAGTAGATPPRTDVYGSEAGGIAAAGSPLAAVSTLGTLPSPPLTLPDTAVASGRPPRGASPGGAPSCERCRTWIVAARPGGAAGRTATRHGAKPLAVVPGLYRIARRQASRFAQDLKRQGLLAWAEPDVPVRPSGYPGDLLAPEQGWLEQIVNPEDTTPPPVQPDSPVVGLIEKGIDPTHPDLLEAALAGASPTGDPARDSHGTSIAGIIGSPGGDGGIRGVWPGARMRHFPAGETCTTAATAVTAAVDAGVSVLNMSYTMPRCYTHYLATAYAVSRSVVPVAAAGNTGSTGNAVQWPAADPHVISVGAVDPANTVVPFSTRNRFVDITAPGVDVLAPVSWRDSGCRPTAVLSHTWCGVSGTSFSTPMVTAAAAWLRQARPGFTASQIARVLIASGTDLGAPGRDPDYGEGLLDLDAALTARRPVNDPLEPNDEIAILRGETLVRRARPLWKPKGPRVVKLRATLSRDGDPVDIYRVRLPARRQVLITARQLKGDVRVTALKPGARRLDRIRKKVIVTSDRKTSGTEAIKLRNLRRKPRDIWLVITPGRRQGPETVVYRLGIRRS